MPGFFCVAYSHPALGLQRWEGITRRPGEGTPVTVRILPQTSQAQGKSQVHLQKIKLGCRFSFSSFSFCLSAQFKFVFYRLSKIGRQRSNELEQILQPVKMASSGYPSWEGSSHNRTSNQDLPPSLPLIQFFFCKQQWRIWRILWHFSLAGCAHLSPFLLIYFG